MILELYKTLDNNNVINKTITNKETFNIKLKENTNMIEPKIILSSTNIIDFNYAYIPDFKRYYFITDITINSKNIYVISLECDVLESFKDDVLNSFAYINKTTESNKYYNSNYENEVRKEVNIYYSDVELEDVNNNILVVFGKGAE